MGQVPGLTWPPIRITTLYNAPTESSASGQQKGEGISGSESTLVSATDGRSGRVVCEPEMQRSLVHWHATDSVMSQMHKRHAGTASTRRQ